jgi:hypothetical protein
MGFVLGWVGGCFLFLMVVFHVGMRRGGTHRSRPAEKRGAQAQTSSEPSRLAHRFRLASALLRFSASIMIFLVGRRVPPQRWWPATSGGGAQGECMVEPEWRVPGGPPPLGAGRKGSAWWSQNGEFRPNASIHAPLLHRRPRRCRSTLAGNPTCSPSRNFEGKH